MNHIVCLSGGKDSTAMALRLTELAPRDYIYVCTPTGDELPDMVAHWDKLSQVLGKKILEIRPPFDLKGLCERENALPNWRMRFCTRALKIIPYQSWIMQHLPAISYVGLRADEEGRVGIEWDGESQLQTKYPLRDWGWGKNEVLAYLEKRDILIPPRTDCARCFFQTLHEWYCLWRYHPDIYRDAEKQEAKVGHTFRSPQRDTWPPGLRELRKEFEQGRVPKRRNRGDGCKMCSM